MNQNAEIRPFENCPALDGYHCQTSSLAKLFRFYGHPLSEEMMLGLGAGMGFMYWKMKIGGADSVFIGGRTNKAFFEDLGRRTGVTMQVVTTSSKRRAESALLEKLKRGEPAMLFGDMGYLPWFHFPMDYHFGGHTFVVCGYDGERTVLASDMDQAASGPKPGFYFPVSLEQLSKARSSSYKPFPPNNAMLDVDFSAYRPPDGENIRSAIAQTCNGMLNPPIKNMGVSGIRYAAKEILRWGERFAEHDLRMNLFNLYVFIEIGGTGGGCFRYMYSRFLKEAAAITGDDRLLALAADMQHAGEILSEIGLLFKDPETAHDLDTRIRQASELFVQAAALEESTFSALENVVSQEHIPVP